MEFLGYLVGNGRIKPQPAKIKAILEYPKPTNQKELHRFVGLMGYHRKFIKDFAEKATPLYYLLRKDVPFNWNKEQENSFETLKANLASEPVLQIFDPKLSTELHTDASTVGISGILYQNKHLVAFYSRRVSDTESRYTTTELE